MKRFLALSLVLASMTLLFSCEDTKIHVTANADIPTSVVDYEEASLDEFVIEVDAAETLALIASREHFVLYIGNSSCSSCVAFRPAFIEYIHKSKATVYHFDNLVQAMDYDQLPEHYPDFFTADYAVTPSLYFFKEGLMTARRYGSTRMMDYATLKPIMEGYMTITHIETSHNVTLLEFIQDTQGVIFFYDRSDDIQNACYVDTIYSKASKSSNVLTVADIPSFDLTEEEQTTFMATFEIDNISGWIVHYDAGEIESSYHLSVENDVELDAWLTTHF